MLRLTDVTSPHHHSVGGSAGGVTTSSPPAKMSSHLVETVNINYDDFSDSFLTCGTCLCMYDAHERTPKLLQCSHTVCRSCLQRIVEASSGGTGSSSTPATTLRCPICRETMALPRGGVASFPPSFIVNQLIDLMASQRRDVVPRCAAHAHRELLFCETCDMVFCSDCDAESGPGEQHGSGGGTAHTVIPLSVAIKRMSEILLYRAGLCARRLEAASNAVALEVEQVEAAAERCAEHAAKAFEDLLATVEQRRHSVAQAVRRLRRQKLAGLHEQLAMIDAEKARVRADCQMGLPPESQVEVRNITKRISDLNEKLDVSATLSEPRENAFLQFESDHNDARDAFTRAVNAFGRIRVSTTFPALCTATLPNTLTVRLRSVVTVATVDNHGNARTTGGDPLAARLRGPSDDEDVSTVVMDRGDGSYTVQFTATEEGRHWLHVSVFEREIRGSPFALDAGRHLPPVARLTAHCGRAFIQPVALALQRRDGVDLIYVLDAGNGRVCVLPVDTIGNGLPPPAASCRQLSGPGLEQRSGTGMALMPSGSVVVSNWRTMHVTELCTTDSADASQFGDVITKWTFAELVEPTCVAVTRQAEVIVADNGARMLFIFEGATGRLLRRMASDGEHHVRLVNGLHVAPNGELIVADDRLQVFNMNGAFVRQIVSHNGPGGQYGDVTVDCSGRLLATRSRKGKAFVEVYDANGDWILDIDSAGEMLRRPSGLVTSRDGHVYVADLGNNCVKKFRYL